MTLAIKLIDKELESRYEQLRQERTVPNNLISASNQVSMAHRFGYDTLCLTCEVRMLEMLKYRLLKE